MKLDRLNRMEALRYMGFKGGEIPAGISALVDECEERLLSGISPKYVWRVFDIEKTDRGIEAANTPLVFEGRDIVLHLKGCEKCVMLCVTLGADADRIIRSCESEAMEKAVIVDSLASAAVEQACDKAEDEIHSRLAGYHFTWRFSPGYGDFPLDIQRDFLKVLNAEKRIGLSVSESLILTPRKSVTAVIGISEHEISKGRRGCGCCNMKDVCEYRKRGSHCGQQ